MQFRILTKHLLILERIVLLSVRHRTRLEPAIKHLRHTVQHALTLLTGDLQVINAVAVKISHLGAGELLQLLNATHHNHLLTVLAGPDGERRTPVAVTRDVPVTSVAQPVMETLLLDERGHPVGELVVGHQAVFDGRHADEPGADSTVDQRSIGTIAEGVAVDDAGLLHQTTFRLQTSHDVVIALLDIASFVIRHLAIEVTAEVHRAGDLATQLNDAVRNTHTVIVLSETGSAVDNTGTAVVGDVSVTDNAEGVRPVLEVGEERLVTTTHQILSHTLLENLKLTALVALLQHLGVQDGETAFGHPVETAGSDVLDLDVLEVGVDGESHVTGESPRRGRPSEVVHV